MKEFFSKLFHDSRFWVAVVTALVIALKTALPTFPIDEATISNILLAAIFAIFGITTVDVAVTKFSKTIIDMQKMHQEDMKTLYNKFVK